MISSDEYRAAGGAGDNAGEASDGGCGGTEEDGCCARAIVVAKQTTTMAARCQVESKNRRRSFHAAHLRTARVEATSRSLMPTELITNQDHRLALSKCKREPTTSQVQYAE